MAELEFLLQAAAEATHAEAIRVLLSGNAHDSVLIGVAFVRQAGVEAIEEALRPVAARTKVYVGIRNDITTVQGIKHLLALKAQVFAVDTASRDAIFHPKLYLAVGKQKASMIIGSANLTFPGLHNNIEASALVALDLTNERDLRFVEDTLTTFDGLPKTHPQHVFAIKDEDHAGALFQAGRLSDETVNRAPSIPRVVGRDKGDTLPRMVLSSVARSRISSQSTDPEVPTPPPVETVAAATPPNAPPALPAPGRALDYYLVWERRGLMRNALTIPTAAGTNPTGSMGFNKGELQYIDQRHFFREDVFAALPWTTDPKKAHLERSVGSFELVIKNISRGTFDLRLTHSTDTTGTTYLQNNEMTHLHWDGARPFIAQEDLLGRTLYLYRRDKTPPEFLIEID